MASADADDQLQCNTEDHTNNDCESSSARTPLHGFLDHLSRKVRSLEKQQRARDQRIEQLEKQQRASDQRIEQLEKQQRASDQRIEQLERLCGTAASPHCTSRPTEVQPEDPSNRASTIRGRQPRDLPMISPCASHGLEQVPPQEHELQTRLRDCVFAIRSQGVYEEDEELAEKISTLHTRILEVIYGRRGVKRQMEESPADVASCRHAIEDLRTQYISRSSSASVELLGERALGTGPAYENEGTTPKAFNTPVDSRPKQLTKKRGLARGVSKKRGRPAGTAKKRGRPAGTAKKRGRPAGTAKKRGLPAGTAKRRATTARVKTSRRIEHVGQQTKQNDYDVDYISDTDSFSRSPISGDDFRIYQVKTEGFISPKSVTQYWTLCPHSDELVHYVLWEIKPDVKYQSYEEPVNFDLLLADISEVRWSLDALRIHIVVVDGPSLPDGNKRGDFMVAFKRENTMKRFIKLCETESIDLIEEDRETLDQRWEDIKSESELLGSKPVDMHQASQGDQSF